MEDKRLYEVTMDKFKELIEPIIIKNLNKTGRPSKISHYNFGVLYVLRTGIAWRDMPKNYGNWHTIYTRYKRWCESGFFWHLLNELQSRKEIKLDVIFVDGSIIPLHRHGGGALKK